MSEVMGDVLVIGAGPAGIAAATSAARFGAESVMLIERDNRLGGILFQCIHNGFGLYRYNEELTGPEYAQRDIDGLLKNSVIVKSNTFAADIIRNDSSFGVLLLCHDNAEWISARSIILAMGCRERTAGAISLPGQRPSGFYTAGTAQRLMNIQNVKVGTSVVIVGSGDIGMIMARRMTLEGSIVKAVTEIMPFPGGLARNIHQCLHDFGIPLFLSTGISQVYGRHRVEGVRIAPVDENGQLNDSEGRDIECDTLLLSVGLIPENELSKKASVKLDPRTQGAMVDANCMTSVPGIFACGNVLHVHDVADFVTEESELAGNAAARWVADPLIGQLSVPVSCAEDIRYTVPQSINEMKETIISLRVARPRPSCKIIIRQKNRILASKSYIRLQPSEMVRIPVTIERIEPVEVFCETTR